VNHRLLAGFLFAYAACALAGILPAAVLAARERKPGAAAVAAAVALSIAAVLVNAGADLW
jgi:hypothetical protein